MKGTLGLTGLTMNAMALIAPGAFLWLTFSMQSTYGAPMAGSGMWFGILAALLLCYATAISYAELSKLYPGAGSSYVFAEQAFMRKTHAYKLARLSKFIVGWASHLYYWVYPGVMVGVTAMIVGYIAGQLKPEIFSPGVSSPTLMIGFCVIFAFGVAYIAYRGVVGATGVNIAINVIQISALLVFSLIAIGYRMSHPQDSVGWQLDPDGKAINVNLATYKVDDKGNPVGKDGKSLLDKDGNLPESAVALLVPDDSASGKPVKDPKITSPSDWETAYIVAKDEKGNPVPFKLDYTKAIDKVADPSDSTKQVDGRMYFEDAKSVVAPHAFSYMIIQACIAILILVGFESVTAMGEEAKDPKRHIPWAVLLSLTIQGAICYLIEYFAANYALNNGYNMTTASASSAPIGDMMKLIGAWLFGSPQAGWWFMFIEAITVFLALIGTTLSCINTGARVTYAMGRDDEVPSHFGMLHGKNLTPHRAIWTLAAISAVIGIIAVLSPVSGPFSTSDLPSQLTPEQQHSIWYPMSLIPDAAQIKTLPNTLLIVTLMSNFGTFMLYMLTCVVAIVAFREHHTFNTVKHTFVPLFGLVANLACMLFYLVGPFTVSGMSWKEPYIALLAAALWGLYGAFYFARASSKKGKAAFLTPEQKAAALAGSTS